MRQPGEREAFLSRPQLYGGFGNSGLEMKLVTSALGQRHRINVGSAVLSLLLPWLLFCGVYADLSFSLHYFDPVLCWVIVGGCCIIVFLVCALACRNTVEKIRAVDPSPEPNWITFLAITMVVALILGVALGTMNFSLHLQSFYDYTNLNDYEEVNPAVLPGQEIMDAGRVVFSNNSGLDLRRSMGFKNLDTYCVSPINAVLSNGAFPTLTQYDFWAIGLNCCSGNTADFSCGPYNDLTVHGGLRLLADEQRAFFELAVQQAVAAYAIQAPSPMFFYWVSNPTEEMVSYRDDGYKYFMIGILTHFAWQSLAVCLAAAGFSKLRY